MTIEWACTHICKEVEEDSFEHGCIGKRSCIMDERCNITAESLPELLAKIGEHYGLDIDDVFIPNMDDDDEGITWIDWNRLENADCDEPAGHEKERWKQGRCTLYLADYSFWIEKREMHKITLADFAEAKIKTH